MDKCVNCQFYDRKPARTTDGRSTMWGQCRRHSPQLNPQTAKAYVVEGVWPTVRDDDWCGEWSAMPASGQPRVRGAIVGRELMAVGAGAPDAEVPAWSLSDGKPLSRAAGDD